MIKRVNGRFKSPEVASMAKKDPDRLLQKTDVLHFKGGRLYTEHRVGREKKLHALKILAHVLLRKCQHNIHAIFPLKL